MRVRLKRSALPLVWGRSGAAVHDGAFGEHCGERTRDEVRTVVGEDLVDSHVVGPEPVLGASPELHEGGGGFVVVGFDVGDTGVVVDRDMEMGVAHAAAAGAFGLLRTAPGIPQPPTGGILPTFLMSRCTNSPGAERS